MTTTVTSLPSVDADSAYGSAREQIEAEFAWLMLRLRLVVEQGRRQRALGPAEEHRGIYVSDEEVDDLLAEPSQTDAVDSEALRQRAAAMRTSLDRRGEASEAAGLDLPLERVARAFDLSRDERLVLVATLATHFDRAYEKVFAYANDDVAHKSPTVGVVLDALTDDRSQALRLRSIFSAAAPLAVHGLVTTVDDQSTPAASLLASSVRMADHVAAVLLGHGGLDPALHSVAAMLERTPGEGGDSALAAVLRRHRDSRIYIGGRWWAEKRAEVASACDSVGLATIHVDTAALREADGQAALLRLLARDARLIGAALYFDGWGADAGDAERAAETLGRRVQRQFDGHPLPLILSGREARSGTLEPRLHLQVELPAPSFEDRRREWDAAEASDWGDGGADRLAATFRLGSHEIRAALRMARSLADWQGEEAVSLEDLRAAARLQSQPKLSDMARRVEPRFGWDDIVLPEDRLAQLREISTQALYQHVVYEQWGFDAKAALGRGVASLFVGDPGTGKTMAAEIVAMELGLDLYKIDLSGLVSKYIGETEKNLARIFDEAGDSNAILFFDEADAIFGKRTEVRDSHDRYANIEVSYLLQKMEEYDGIVVLASNLRANLDDAFLRRLKAIIDFPFPEEEDRLAIYHRMLAGTTAPLADDVDLPFMARQFRIAGGNIKNIVIFGAFLAAESGSPIAMRHLIHATRREYQKLGRLLTESDFADWYDEVRP